MPARDDTALPLPAPTRHEQAEQRAGAKLRQGQGPGGDGEETQWRRTGTPPTPVSAEDGLDDWDLQAGGAVAVAGVVDEEDSSAPPREILHSDGTADGGKHGKHGKHGRHTKHCIRWAPLHVQLEQRLQTAVVLWHSLSIASFVALFFFLCAIPLLWPLLAPYLLYTQCVSDAATNGRLALRSERFRRLWVWRAFGAYFPARLHRSCPLPPTRKYVFGYHPHGIISHGAFAGFGTDALGFAALFPGITNSLLTLDANFRLPLYREYALALGLASVSRASCENLLTRGGADGAGMGRGVTIVVGGARESLEAQPGSLRLILRRRKGFVRLAVRTGADLVPVLAFGEAELYEQARRDAHRWVHRAQLLVKKIAGFTVPLFHARGVFNYDVGLMPYRRPLNIVVGRPILVRKAPDGCAPDPQYVDRLHELYVQELVRLWETHRDEFAPDRRTEMEII
ncbi:diacylglycerol O-acyltransferase 1, partial [Ascosphaera acerosa]